MKPTIWKMLDISVGHISRETRNMLDEPDPWSLEHNELAVPETPGLYQSPVGPHRWLDGGGRHVLSIPFEYGWIVYAHDDELEMPDNVESSYPADLLAIFRFARRHGCDWIKIDADGAEYDVKSSLAIACGLVVYDDDCDFPQAEVIDCGEKILRQREADRIDGYDRDDLGESPDF